MKLNLYLSIVVICLTLFPIVINAADQTIIVPTERGRVDSRLNKKLTLYRAVTAEETNQVNNIYRVGQRVTQHSTAKGDFAPEGVGALYVFDNIKDAQRWGVQCSQMTRYKDYYIVSLEYTPQKGRFNLKYFDRAMKDWEAFMNNNHQSKKNLGVFDVVEGPIMGEIFYQGKMQKKGVFSDAHKLIWQGAFITPKGMSTLKVIDIKKYPVSPGVLGKIFSCPIQ